MSRPIIKHSEDYLGSGSVPGRKESWPTLKRRNIYKVLSLGNVFQSHFFVDNLLIEMETYRDEIPPVFKRDGSYYDRYSGVAWLEWQGRAWLEKRKDDFLYSLQIEDHRPLMPREIEAIKTLLRTNRCPKNLLKLYQTDCRWKELRNVRRNTRLFMMKNLKELGT